MNGLVKYLFKKTFLKASMQKVLPTKWIQNSPKFWHNMRHCRQFHCITKSTFNFTNRWLKIKWAGVCKFFLPRPLNNRLPTFNSLVNHQNWNHPSKNCIRYITLNLVIVLQLRNKIHKLLFAQDLLKQIVLISIKSNQH